MKRLLAVAFATSALAAAAIEGGNQIGVLEIASSANDTIVAVPYTSLNGGSVKVSELVKTTNLKAGDSLWVFNGSSYTAWVLNADGGSWAATDVAVPSGSSLSVSAGGAPATTGLTLGSAIWLRRSNPTGSFYIYGQYEDAVSSTIAAGTDEAPVWNLIANPKSTAVEFNFAGAEGDTVRITSTKFPKVYTYTGGKWTYKGVAQTPTIPAGQGLWYVSQGGSGTYSWQ